MMVKEVKLTQNCVALVDDEDYDWLMKYKWHVAKYRGFCYAAYTLNRPSKNTKSGQTSKKIFMHRLILNAKDGDICDHIDGNTLNDQKYNLRIVTHTQNVTNSKKSSRRCSSRFKGVCWAKKSHKWWVVIEVNGKTVDLGYFIDEVEAAKNYDAAARKYFGEYARLNFPADRQQ